MAFSINRPGGTRAAGPRGAGGSRCFDPVWLAAGAAVVVLAAVVSSRVPEESLSIFLALLTLVLALADLRMGLLAYVGLYPLMPDTWGIDMAEWMPFLTARRLCCIVLTVVFLVHSRDAWDTPRVRRIGSMLAVLVAMQLLVGFTSSDRLSVVKLTFQDIVEFYAPFLMAAHVFRTKAQVRTLLIVALLSMTVVSVLGIIEHAISYDFYDSFTAVRSEVNLNLNVLTQTTRGLGDDMMRRVRVAFPHAIILGLHLMTAILAAIYLARQGRGMRRLLPLAGVLLFCLTLLFTYSRGPMLGLACGLVWLGIIGRGTRPLLLVVLICGLGAYFLMPASSRAVLSDTIVTSTDTEDWVSNGGGTVRARLNLFQAGLQYSTQSLLFGHGVGEVRETKLRSANGATVDLSMLDNYCLAVLLRFGIFVLAWTIFVLGYLLWLFTRAAQRIPDRDAALLAAVASALCVGNYVVLMTMCMYFPLFWILLGAALRAVELHMPEERRGKLPRWRGGREEKRTMETWKQGNHAGANAPIPVGVGPRIAKRLGLALPVLVVLTLAGAVPCQSAPSFYGTTGLFTTPVGAVAPRGAWSIGSNYVGRDYRPGASSISQGTVANFFTLTMLPRVELTVVLTNYEGKLGAQNLNHGLTSDFNLGGLTVDRTASMQWMAVSQHGYRPSLAFGMRDFLGRPVKHLQAQYAVMSLNHRRLTLSAGVGTLALRGPFGGVEYALTPHVSAIAEGLNSGANGGLRLMPLKDVQLDMALMGFRSLGGGLSYRRRF